MKVILTENPMYPGYLNIEVADDHLVQIPTHAIRIFKDEGMGETFEIELELDKLKIAVDCLAKKE